MMRIAGSLVPAVGFMLIMGVVGPLSQSTWADETNIPLKVAFASEKNGPFTAEFPRVVQGGKVWLRVNWEGFVRPDGSREPYIVVVMGDTDFASANGGKPSYSQGKYLQRPSPPWVSLGTSSVDMLIDLGERGKGITGVMNKWDPAANKFVDGELLPCPSLKKGEYRFTVRANYNKGGATGKVSGETAFTITVDDAAPGSVK